MEKIGEVLYVDLPHRRSVDVYPYMRCERRCVSWHTTRMPGVVGLDEQGVRVR